jgi:hypothetical protein
MNGFRAKEHPVALPAGFGQKFPESLAKNAASCLAPTQLEPANPTHIPVSFLAHVKNWSHGFEHWGLND